MVSTEDKTDTTMTPYQNTDIERKQRYLLIGTVFICYTIIYIIIILFSVFANKPKLDKDNSTIKTEAILLDTSMTPYSFNKDTLAVTALDNIDKKNALVGNHYADSAQADGNATDKNKFDLVRAFYVDKLVAFEREIEDLFKIYNDHEMKAEDKEKKVKGIMETDKAIYKLTHLYGTLQAVYYKKYGKEDKSKKKDKAELKADFDTKSEEVCTICEEGLNNWFNNFDKVNKLRVYATKEDSPDNEEFAKKWYLGYMVTYGNYTKEFPGSVGVIQNYVLTVAEIWDKEIYEKDSDKAKRTNYKTATDLEKEDKK
eukprot:GAHX01000356.1.p1 GENE.GAHX01000356.1~~GAHX01000356.1.p1  ORF type:complete len:327 (-),score=91.60 GAHX01000356.1:34-972(-)